MSLLRRLPAGVFPAPAVPSAAWTVVLPRLLRLLPTPGYAATTIGPLIFVRDHDADPALLRHEAVHVWQWRTLGWIRFAVRYLREFAAGVGGGLRAREAYLAISLEQEARALAAGAEAVGRVS